jgi:hypothetical protein
MISGTAGNLMLSTGHFKRGYTGMVFLDDTSCQIIEYDNSLDTHEATKNETIICERYAYCNHWTCNCIYSIDNKKLDDRYRKFFYHKSIWLVQFALVSGLTFCGLRRIIGSDGETYLEPILLCPPDSTLVDDTFDTFDTFDEVDDVDSTCDDATLVNDTCDVATFDEVNTLVTADTLLKL